MSRPLTPEEEALWARVRQTVRPLGERQTPQPVTMRLPARAAPPPLSPARQAKQAPHTESLDRGWDRRLSSGKLLPDLVLDLHGHTREGARRLLLSRVAAAYQQGLRVLLVVTGKGQRGQKSLSSADMMPGLGGPDRLRGSIKAELPRWLGEQSVSPYIAAVRRAHPRHGGDGAVYLIIRRQRH